MKIRGKSKISTIALILLLTISATLVALPAVSAQANWSIYITTRISDGRVSGEVRLNNVRQWGETFTGGMLAVKTPGAADWTYLGPFTTSWGGFTYYYEFTEVGTYQFQWIVPASGSLPVNPDTADGKWYSDIGYIDTGYNIYIDCPSFYPTNFPFTVGMEVRLGATPQIGTFSDIMLAVKLPGADWTEQGPYSTTDGSVDVTFTGTVEDTTFEFQWIVPPQGVLPENDDTVDGKWYSQVDTTLMRTTSKTTYPYLGVIPNPVGVNQQVLFHLGITDALGSVELGWENLTITVIDPEGIESTLGPYRTDATGGTGGDFIPTKVGDYVLQTNFPAQLYGTTVYSAGTSELLTLVVQQDAIPYYPGHSLPKEYWTRPIDAQLREWYTVAGNWLNLGFDQDPKYAPYNDDAPETAHILWTKPIYGIGGLVGGAVGEGVSYEIGDAYEGKFPNRIILAGRLYYTIGGSRGLDLVETICLDLHTGQELWRKVFRNNSSLSFGQTLFWDGFNNHGTYPYLYIVSGSTWYVYDADTGDWRWTITHVPSGDRIVDSKGEVQVLRVDTSNDRMTLWAISGWIAGRSGSTAGSWGNTVEGQELDADDFGDDAYLWDVPIPDDLIGGVDWVLEDRVIGASLSRTEVTLWGLSTEPGKEGDFLFQNTWQAPAYWEEGSVTVSGFGGGWMLNHDNVAVLWIKETREYYGFSLETGKNIWGPTEPQYYLDAVDDTPTESRAAAYGYFYSLSLGGIVYCYNITTGVLEWDYPIEDYYQEFLFANNWWGKPVFIADGKIYLGHTEHSPIDPRPRGAPFVCLDAYTGELIFRADSLFRSTRWGGRAIIGDSIIATMDTYDQRLYAIGKGPSATTVSIQNDVITHGSNTLIKGTVTDVSPGTQATDLQLRFPNGVPAISDASMSAWMLYVYKNFERPADAVGVQVKIEAYDPNGNYQDLGTATCDSYGNFGFVFEPEILGTYWISATFEGSGGYYGSKSTTYLQVDPAPEPYPDVPTAEEIAADAAQRTINMLPQYPDVPTAEEIAAETAQRTINMLPAYPDVGEIPEIPAYLTIDLAIIAAVVIAIIIGIVSYLTLRKQK